MSTHILLSIAQNPVTHVEHEVIRHASSDPNVTEQSTYYIARMLMRFVEWVLGIFGLAKDENLFAILYIGVVFVFSIALGMALKWVVVFLLNKLSPHIKSILYTNLVKKKFFLKACRIIPALFLMILIQFTLYMHTSIASWLTRLTLIYVVVIVSMALCSLSDVIWATLDARDNKKKLPLHGVVQVIKLIVWVFCVIVVIAILLNKSPGALLAGLGAFAAVLMLIFKDSILGIVAGVQLAENDSLHVGDWIAVPGSQANGIVSEVSLTDVKIINWDKTVSTVPPYTLISGGFRNYRNMQESGTRQIQRSYMIDADSVVEATDDMLAEFSKIPLMSDWIAKKIEQRKAGKEENVDNSEGLADGTIDTNLGMFRAYLSMYLSSSKDIDQTSTHFVTTLAQQSTGIPLQIYCFTKTSSWIPYEGIQAALFEHIAVMLYRFHLYTCEAASGRDTILADYLCSGKSPQDIFGMPYPFFLNSGTPMNPGIPPQVGNQKGEN